MHDESHPTFSPTYKPRCPETSCHRRVLSAAKDLGEFGKHFLLGYIQGVTFNVTFNVTLLSIPLSVPFQPTDSSLGRITIGSCALEFRATDHVRDKHLSGLRAFKEEGQCPRYIIVSCNPEERVTVDGIRILPWATIFEAIVVWKTFLTVF